ncbi:MAG: carbohydrate ABC transporter permease [Spirochaetales bacterium]|nr:carbohydrate ABC transporter permease [Spirochaetales bacterium]
MDVRTHRNIKLTVTYLLLIPFMIVMVYPLIWMFFAGFKTNGEIFGTLNLLPEHFLLDGFINGWKGVGKTTFGLFFRNTLKLVIPTVLATLLSATFVAYGFARFNFPFKKIFFALMISMLMLPNSVVIIPRYILFNKWRWLDSYLPFWIPALFACNSFFIFMMIQFLRSIPKDLDEAAKIDGCNAFSILGRILVPLMKPALFSAGLFQLMWTWNDFFNCLIYISKVKYFPLSLGLRISVDSASAVQWNQVMAMSTLSILPTIIIFFCSQRYFIEGVATSGIKG